MVNFARFATFPIFSHRSGSEWFGMANFTQFSTFPIFSHWSGSEWLRMANFARFTTFLIFSHQSGSEWLRTANFARFATFTIFSYRSGSEWLGMANFARFATFPIFYHWSGSEWLGTPNFAWFTLFSNLFPLKSLRMTRNGQFCMAKIKCTLIQGNFYERLPIYMDNCALSPMASLLDYIELLMIGHCAGASTNVEWDCKIGCIVEMNFQ